jgi:superkiller protein 8
VGQVSYSTRSSISWLTRTSPCLVGKDDGHVRQIALSADAQYLVSTTSDGRFNVWNLDDGRKKLHQYETKGNYGMCIDLVRETASTESFQKADMYFQVRGWPLHCHRPREWRHLYLRQWQRPHDSFIAWCSFPPCLPSRRCLMPGNPGLMKPVRAVAFSPGGKLLAAAGDARMIGLYDVQSGEQVALLTGHASWIFSLDWNHTGEYLLTG